MEAERKACKSDCEGNSLSYVRLLQMPALRQSRSCVRSSVTIETWKPPGKTMYFSFHLVFSLLFSNASNPHFEVFVFFVQFRLLFFTKYGILTICLQIICAVFEHAATFSGGAPGFIQKALIAQRIRTAGQIIAAVPYKNRFVQKRLRCPGLNF